MNIEEVTGRRKNFKFYLLCYICTCIQTKNLFKTNEIRLINILLNFIMKGYEKNFV